MSGVEKTPPVPLCHSPDDKIPIKPKKLPCSVFCCLHYSLFCLYVKPYCHWSFFFLISKGKVKDLRNVPPKKVTVWQYWHKMFQYTKGFADAYYRPGHVGYVGMLWTIWRLSQQALEVASAKQLCRQMSHWAQLLWVRATSASDVMSPHLVVQKLTAG